MPLRRRADFERLFATGHRVRRGGITVLCAPSSDGETRVAVIASRKVGSAVRRNRAKRRLRAILADVDLPEATHVAVIAGPSVPDVDFDRLRDWVSAGLPEEQHVG
ncbi:MAG: ribonuclease P protein component [Acidimicrobiia bacterium]